MKPIRILFEVVLCALVFSGSLFSQVTGDYRTTGVGLTGSNWTSPSAWQRYNGSAWVAAPSPPTGTGTMTIQSADSIYLNVATSITGTLVNRGRLGNGTNLTIENGGAFQHDQDAGSLPFATWSTGSTLILTGTVSTAPSNRNQSFYNVTFNTPGLTSNRDMGFDSVTIGGNVTVTNTGSSRWQLTSASGGDSSIFSIMGDLIMTNGQCSSNGTSNANTKFEIHQFGNINVTGGNFSISRGSQGGGTGSTRWYLHSGNFSMSNATTQNSNQTNAWFVFDKAGTQNLTLGAGNTLSSLPIEVASGTTLDMGQSKLRGNGLFTLNAGATLATAADGGLDSAMQSTGTVTLDNGASFTFNGTSAQVTGMKMPTTVNNLTVNNSAGVTLSQATTINGVLRLVSGVFDNTIPFTLGPSGTISFEGGSLLIPTSVETLDEAIPQTFFVDQNYPNPFNPSTTIRFGIPTNSPVTAKVFNLLGQEVETLFEGQLTAGVHSVRFNPANLSSGLYLYRIQAGTSAEVKRMIFMK